MIAGSGRSEGPILGQNPDVDLFLTIFPSSKNSPSYTTGSGSPGDTLRSFRGFGDIEKTGG